MSIEGWGVKPGSTTLLAMWAARAVGGALVAGAGVLVATWRWRVPR